jgi:hypothetical protein
MPDYDSIIRQARYIAPSGATFVLQFDDVERASAKKVAVHELPQQDTPIVQDQGNQAKRYPFACYFTGDNCYTDADALDAALAEIGPGTFEHPMFGNLEVLAETWGEVRKLVDGLGRVDFTIAFVQAPKITALSASTAGSVSDELNRSVDDAMAASSESAAGKFDPANAADKTKSKNGILKGVNSFSTATRNIASGVSDVSTAISRQVRNITNNIDDLIGAPLELFNALATLAKTPATITTGIANKINAYREQALSIAESIPASYAQAVSSVESLFYALGGACQSSTNGDLFSRSNAIAAADSLGSITDTVLGFVESSESAVPGYHPDSEILAQFLDAASKARAALLASAFNLRTERRITLDVETTPLNLIAQFYGTSPLEVPDLDAALDEIISSNGLIGEEIFLIPAGREVVYYV